MSKNIPFICRVQTKSKVYFARNYNGTIVFTTFEVLIQPAIHETFLCTLRNVPVKGLQVHLKLFKLANQENKWKK